MPLEKAILIYKGVRVEFFFFSRVCFQISAGLSLGIREFLEEFLSKWHLVDGRYSVLVDANVDANVQKGCDERSFLGIDEFMEVVEIYAVTLLGKTLKDLDLAIAWVEKAAIPEERRQVYFKLLHLYLCPLLLLNCLTGVMPTCMLVFFVFS